MTHDDYDKRIVLQGSWIFELLSSDLLFRLQTDGPESVRSFGFSHPEC